MNERISKAFWLWGQFDPQTTNTLKKIKEETLASLGGPIFEEHITISGPLKKKGPSRIISVKNALHSVRPITLEVLGYGYKDVYFQALFLKIKKTKELIHLKKILDRELGLTTAGYFPHISLFYGKESKDNKSKIIKSLPSAPKKLILNKICHLDVDECIESWNIRKKFLLS